MEETGISEQIDKIAIEWWEENMDKFDQFFSSRFDEVHGQNLKFLLDDKQIVIICKGAGCKLCSLTYRDRT